MPDAPPAPPPPAPAAAPEPLSVALGRRFFKVRGWVYLPVAAAALALRWNEWNRPEVNWPAGGALVLAGVWLRFASIRRIGGAARTHKHKAKRLVDTGPYAWVRNPLYIANTAAFLGFVLLCALPWLALASAIFLGAWYHAIARYEETVVAGAFGAEFEAYRARTPLWIPRPPRSTPVEDPEDLYPMGKLLKRERGALLNVAFMVALAACKQWWWR